MESRLITQVSYIYLYDEDGMLNITIDYEQHGVGGKLGDDLNYWEVKKLANHLLDWCVKHPKMEEKEKIK